VHGTKVVRLDSGIFVERIDFHTCGVVLLQVMAEIPFVEKSGED